MVKELSKYKLNLKNSLKILFFHIHFLLKPYLLKSSIQHQLYYKMNVYEEAHPCKIYDLSKKIDN